jgi:hypothetical protein
MPRLSSSSANTDHGGTLLRWGLAHAPVYIPPPRPVDRPPPGPVERPPPGPVDKPPPGPVERPPPGPVESPPPGPVDIPPPGPVERPPPGPVDAPPPGPVDVPPPGPVDSPPPRPVYLSLGHVLRDIPRLSLPGWTMPNKQYALCRGRVRPRTQEVSANRAISTICYGQQHSQTCPPDRATDAGGVRPDDLDCLAYLLSHPEVVPYIGDGTTATFDQAEQWLARTLAHRGRNEFAYWQLGLRGEGEFAGCAVCFALRERSRSNWAMPFGAFRGSGRWS